MEQILPSDNNSRELLKNAIIEIVSSKYRMEGEKDLQKNIIENLQEKVNIDKKTINTFVKWQMNNSSSQDLAEISELEGAYDILFKSNDIET